jgi:hypothetical protein
MAVPAILTQDARLIHVQNEKTSTPIIAPRKKHTQRLAREYPPPVRTVFPPFELEDHPIDERRAIKAIVTGAGISGVTAGILLPVKVPCLELAIYERASDVVRKTVVRLVG